MKTEEEVFDKIMRAYLDSHGSKKEGIKATKTELESYAKEHALAFQKYITELYGIGGFEEDDEIEYNEWITNKTE